MSARRPYWPWGVGLDKRRARRLRRRAGREIAKVDRIIDAASAVVGATLLPWQRDYLRAVLSGQHAVIVRGRRAGHTTVLRIFDEAQRLTPTTPTQGETR